MIEVSRSTLWGVVLALSGALVIAFPLTGLSLDPSRAGPTIAIFAMAGAIAMGRHRLHRAWMGHCADFVETTTLFSAVGMIGALASYAVATTTTGYRDDVLASADRALGFDWVAYYKFVVAYPPFARLAEFFYLTIFLSPTLVIFGLTMTGRAGRARTFVAAIALTLAVTLIGFYFFPARSAVAYHIGMVPAYLPATGLHHVDVIDHLRDGSLTTIDPIVLSGLITFPSFHMISATLFIWAVWPVRQLRALCVAMNVMMIIITPVEGSHYFVDLFGGGAIAVLAIIGFYWPLFSKKFRWRLSKAAMPATV